MFGREADLANFHLTLERQPRYRMLKEGDRAPDFTAQTDSGATISLKSFRGQTVVLYFYPKDDTPG